MAPSTLIDGYAVTTPMVRRPTRCFNGVVDPHRRIPLANRRRRRARVHASMGPSTLIDGCSTRKPTATRTSTRFNGAVDSQRRIPAPKTETSPPRSRGFNGAVDSQRRIQEQRAGQARQSDASIGPSTASTDTPRSEQGGRRHQGASMGLSTLIDGHEGDRRERDTHVDASMGPSILGDGSSCGERTTACIQGLNRAADSRRRTAADSALPIQRAAAPQRGRRFSATDRSRRALREGHVAVRYASMEPAISHRRTVAASAMAVAVSIGASTGPSLLINGQCGARLSSTDTSAPRSAI